MAADTVQFDGLGAKPLCETKKATLTRGLAVIQLGAISTFCFRGPIAKLDKLLYFPTFITVFVGFIRPVRDLPERMLWIPYNFSDNIH